mmetsp:Transcript_29410/g.85915  ORF Transcript_29410/g.85915 Transcript_29410/m.85915 type:complete len:206 (+) Transcript_29410:154-771(+)
MPAVQSFGCSARSIDREPRARASSASSPRCGVASVSRTRSSSGTPDGVLTICALLCGSRLRLHTSVAPRRRSSLSDTADSSSYAMRRAPPRLSAGAALGSKESETSACSPIRVTAASCPPTSRRSSASTPCSSSSGAHSRLSQSSLMLDMTCLSGSASTSRESCSSAGIRSSAIRIRCVSGVAVHRLESPLIASRRCSRLAGGCV